MQLDSSRDLFDRYWSWLKVEAGAPANLPWPRIDVAPLPRNVRMAFVYPAEAAPWHEMRIVVSPRSIDRATRGDLVVIAELAHELVHYVLLLSENGWEIERAVFRNQIHHHCDPEFQRLNRHIGQVIWSAYHSADTLRAIDHMVGLACRQDGRLQVGLSDARRP